jgi:hypothetical protein
MHVPARLRLAALALVALAALLALPGGAGAAPATVSQSTPFDFTVYNECTGEDVRVTGTAVTVTKFTVLPTGKIQILNMGAIIDGQAVGQTTGTVYNPTGQPERDIFNYDPNTDSGPFSFINRQLFIAKGGTDDFHLVESFHVEKTPNGDFVVVRDRFSIDCRG